MDLARFEVLTFDCYGTLIDWESGLIKGLREALGPIGMGQPDEQLLTSWARAESALQAGPYLPYREVMIRAAQEVAHALGGEIPAAQAEKVVASLAGWKPFPDTVSALRALQRRYLLAVVSNIDDDLFAASAAQLKLDFDWVITAEQVKAYKPDPAVFQRALEEIGVRPSQVLHVAQSTFHDIAPARALGLACVHVDRRMGRPGGATPPAYGDPDLRVPDLASLVRLCLADE